MTDIEIAQKAELKPIEEIAKKAGLEKEEIECYGQYKAKITLNKLKELQERVKDEEKRGRLILVTAMTPTPLGEGKSTVSIGLADALNKEGVRAAVALREPSLGPCFGVKGGACGGGHSQVVPMEEINLHFTGDIHAVTTANNLISAIIDNHLQQGNALNIDPRTITWTRCLDLNDRALRNIVVGLGGRVQGVPREEHFVISVASEIMAILCLSKSIEELKTRIANITIAQTYEKEDVKVRQLGCEGAITVLLKDAIKPNIVQTLEGNVAFIHGGPFANIAHGCNSINATLLALASHDYVVTEAGFGADLGAEKFIDIKARRLGVFPSAVVLVASIRALKMHGGVKVEVLKNGGAVADLNSIEKGFSNLKTHIENLKLFGTSPIVAINLFPSDTKEEVETVISLCNKEKVSAIPITVHKDGGEGGRALARQVLEECKRGKKITPLYSLKDSIESKILTLAKKIYRADRVEFSSQALKKLARYQKDYGEYPVCMAKTQNSISHDPLVKGSPAAYTFPIKDLKLCSGAGFITAYAGDIMTMPGLPSSPAALNIDIDNDGVISGLF